MCSGVEAEAVKPRVVFDITSILFDLDRLGTLDEGTRRAEELCGRIISDALVQVLGLSPSVSLNAIYYRLGRTTGAHDLMYSLEEVRSWSSAIDDLAELGGLGEFIVRRLSAEVGERHHYAVFSHEILEGICLRRLQQGLGTVARDASVHSEGFETWYDKGSRAENLTGHQVYLVWANINAGSYQFLVDCNGTVWGQYWVNDETGRVERVS